MTSTSSLSPEEMAKREAERKARRAKAIVAVRQRYKFTYANSPACKPLFDYCVDECPIFRHDNAACLEAGLSCQDRHILWVRRMTEGKCPHFTLIATC